MKRFILLIIFGVFSAQAADDGLEKLRFDSGDESGNEIRALKTEMLVRQSEKKAQEQLDKLLRKYRGTTMEPQLLFRQGELYMRQAKTDRFFELQKGNDKVRRLVPYLVEKASERTLVNKAITIYDSIEKRFKNYENMDLVLFNNGFANQSIRNNSKAKGLYAKLMANYPESPVLPDAYLSMGEMYFQEKNFTKALSYFLEIKKYPDARSYPYGLYKIAWSHYNLNNAKAGLSELEELIEFGRKVKERNLDSRLDLRKEALEDMALFFEDVYPASHAYDYFKKPAADFGVGAVILRLVELYKSHSRHKDVTTVLHDLVERSPTSSYVPIAYNELVHTFETIKDRKNAVKEMTKFHETCQEGSRWTKSQKNNQFSDEYKGFTVAAELNCQDLFDNTSLSLATKWHRMWKKQPQFPELSESAEMAYRLYLDRTRVNKEAGAARFNFAELLFQNKKYREASQNYAIIAEAEKDAQLRHDAGYGALVSLEKAVNDKWKTDDVALFKKLAEVYFKGSPQGKHVLDVKFKIGFIAHENKNYSEAKEIFKVLGAQNKNLELAQKSQDLLMDIFNIEKDYTGLKTYSKNLLGPNLNKERSEKITKIYQESYFSEIQNVEDKGDLAKSITEYLRFAKENKASPLAVKAWWNAIQLYFKIERYSDAAEEGYKFAMAHPEDKGSHDMLIRSAESYEKLGQAYKAADVLMEVAKRNPKDEKKWELMAADLYSVSQKKEGARKIYQKYHKTPSGAFDSRIIAKWQVLEETLNNETELKKVYQLVMSAKIQPQMSIIQIKELDALMDAKKYKEGFEFAKKILGASESTPYAKAKARFYQGVVLEDEFRNQSVKARVDRIAMVLALKTQRLEKVQSAYEQAMKMGVGEIGVKALKRLGQSYLHFAQAVRGMELPNDPEQKAEIDALKAELEKLALPMEEKGYATFMEALNLAKKFAGGGEFIGEIESELNQSTNQQSMPNFKVKIEQPAIMVPKVKEVST